MQGTERRRVGFCFPLLDQVVSPIFFLNVAVLAIYHVMFYSFGLIPASYEDIVDSAWPTLICVCLK